MIDLDYLPRNEGPGALYDQWEAGALSTDGLRTQILKVWGSAEFPAQLGIDPWLEMFGATGYVADGDEPPEWPITAYRGSQLGQPEGFSWTWDLEKARWFARRLTQAGIEGAVYAITLRQEDVLASLNGPDGRGECELVVNPRMLRGDLSPRLLEESN